MDDKSQWKEEDRVEFLHSYNNRCYVTITLFTVCERLNVSNDASVIQSERVYGIFR